jgi:hypothetical protein
VTLDVENLKALLAMKRPCEVAALLREALGLSLVVLVVADTKGVQLGNDDDDSLQASCLVTLMRLSIIEAVSSSGLTGQHTSIDNGGKAS